MTNVVPIEILFKDSELVEATRQLTRAAMLEQQCREGIIYILWQGFKDEPYKLTGGFVGDNQMILRLQSETTIGLLNVCDLPNTYKGIPITNVEIHPFDKEDIRRILWRYNINTGSYYLD